MALLFMQFIRGKITFYLLERWQTWLLPVYALWLGFVGLVFPLIFSFKYEWENIGKVIFVGNGLKSMLINLLRRWS